MMPKTSPRPDGLNTAVAKPAQSTQPAKRFQLPALNLSLGSLTEGTDIPPPLPSPVQEVPTPPKTPPADDAPKKESNGAAHVQANGLETSPKSDVSSSTNGGLKRPVDQGPVSPTYSSRGSLRRYLSKNLLHNAYDEQGSINTQVASRPPSRTASIAAEERKAKRSSGWFRRLRSTDSKRNSMQQFEEVQVVEKKEPPPPTIPEMSAFKIDTAIGDDLFKEIK